MSSLLQWACGLGLRLFRHVYLRSRGDSELGVNESVTLSSVTYPQCSTHNVRVKWWHIMNNANSHLHIISLNFWQDVLCERAVRICQ